MNPSGISSASTSLDNHKLSYSNGYLLLVILCIAFLGFFYGKILLYPNQYLFNSEGDGMKNYYTYAYYIQNNGSNVNFEGLNYPFGEVFVYTDCNPVLAFCVRCLANIFPGITDYSIGVLNFFMILSFFLTSTFLYLIFKNLRVHPLLSLLGAFSIMVLAPQIYRLTGHYSLSYGFVIPLTIFLLIKTEQKRRVVVYSAILLIHIFCSFFTHPYLGLISVSIIVTYLFVKWIFLFRNKDFYSFQTILLFLSTLLPLALFYGVTKVMDTHISRTTNPYGFFEYYADLDTIFLPNHPPFLFLVKKFLPSFTQTWEGWSYVGVVAIAVCFIIGFRLIKYILKKRKLNYSTLEFSQRIIVILLISSIVLVLFSMGLPFRILPKYYLDYFPFIKQFRSIGRFAWVFFFIINIVVIYGIDRYGIRLFVFGKKKLAYGMFFFFPAVIFFEGVSSHIDVSRNIVQSKNVFLQKNLPENMKQMIAAIDVNKYQAIIPLPYYNIGSENYTKEASAETYSASMLFSYHTKLPLISNFSARASIPESKKLMQLFGNSFYNKDIEADFTSELSFLVLYRRSNGMNSHEFDLYDKGTILYQNEVYSLLEVSMDDLFIESESIELHYFNDIKGKLINYKGFLTTDTSSYFFYNGYNDVANKTMINFKGKGTLSFMKNDHLVLADVPASKFSSKKFFNASFWIYNDGFNYGEDVLNNLDFNIYQTINGEKKLIWTVQPKTSMVINNDWSLVELLFQLETNDGNVQFVLEGNDWKNRPMYLDEIFIYPLGSSYYRIDQIDRDTVVDLFKNNHQIRRK